MKIKKPNNSAPTTATTADHSFAYTISYPEGMDLAGEGRSKRCSCSNHIHSWKRFFAETEIKPKKLNIPHFSVPEKKCWQKRRRGKNR